MEFTVFLGIAGLATPYLATTASAVSRDNVMGSAYAPEQIYLGRARALWVGMEIPLGHLRYENVHPSCVETRGRKCGFVIRIAFLHDR